MKKIINLLNAHGVEVHEGTPGNYFVMNGSEEININFWDQNDALTFLGYDPEQLEIYSIN